MPLDENSPSSNKPLVIVLLVTITLVLILLYAAVGLSKCNCGFFDCLSQMSPNEIGDTLAGVFSAGAFLGLIITLLLQMKELRLQRAELSLTRNEFKELRITAQETLKMDKEKEIDQLFETSLTIFVENCRNAVYSRKGVLFIKKATKPGQGNTAQRFIPNRFIPAGRVEEIDSGQYQIVFTHLYDTTREIIEKEFKNKATHELRMEELQSLKGLVESLKLLRDNLGTAQKAIYSAYKIDELYSNLEEIVEL